MVSNRVNPNRTGLFRGLLATFHTLFAFEDKSMLNSGHFRGHLRVFQGTISMFIGFSCFAIVNGITCTINVIIEGPFTILSVNLTMCYDVHGPFQWCSMIYLLKRVIFRSKQVPNYQLDVDPRSSNLCSGRSWWFIASAMSGRRPKCHVGSCEVGTRSWYFQNLGENHPKSTCSSCLIIIFPIRS